MRWVVRIGVLFATLVVLLGIGLAVALPRIAGSDAVRARVQEATRDATGQEVAWEKLSFGLLPPRLVVRQAKVYPPGHASQPSVAAERVGLRLAVLPLLARAVVIDSLALEGVSIRLIRSKQGIELPIAAPASGTPGAEPAQKERTAKESAPEAAAGGALALAVRRVTLRDSRIVLEDRSVDPPVTWELNGVNADAKGTSFDAPIAVELAAALASGGSLRASGTARLDGGVELEAQLDGVTLAPASAYLEAGQKLGGSLSGTLQVRGPASAPERLVADLVLQQGQVAVNEIALRGGLKLTATVEGGFAKPHGSFDVDATDAELAYGEAFTKPRGTAAKLSGRIVSQPDGKLGVDEVRLKIRNFEGQGRLRLGRRLRLELDAPAFEVEGWDRLIPALAEFEPAGQVALQGLRVATEPVQATGRVALSGFRLRPEADGEPITVDGVLEGMGDRVRGENLRAVVADQVLNIDLELLDLGTKPRYRLGVRAAEADTNAILSSLSTLRDTLFGALTLSSDLSGPLSAPKSPLAALRGQARLEIGNGRLRGVSLLRGVFDRLGSLGDAALLAGMLRGGKTLQRFYGDEFELISGTFDVAGGFARTRDLRLVYRNYTVDLRGALGLLDQSLDFSGKLTIQPEVDAALAQATAAQPAAAAAPTARPKVIPLAHVVGTLQAPRIDLSRDAVVSFAASYTLARKRERIEKKIDEALGQGSGKPILDVLDTILGGKRGRR